MDKLQQYYESLPLCTGNTPGNVMFSVYDNDDDVKTDTYGTITIRNENIEKETELVSLPFSASENATTNEVNCALVPIYEDNGKGGANYSECSPRILSGRGAFMSGIARCIGVFDPWMKFGGEDSTLARLRSTN